MGAGVSAGENNDDLVDNLKDANYIKSSKVERVFRAVDRGEYFLQYPAANAYRDVAWKYGHFHISAPCIYSEVMEGLRLEPGMSFLNLGSGTGYLSTMAGLILGHQGINHGVEVHEDVVRYAVGKLEEFKRYSGAVDEFDFCEPKFIQGNCLCLASGCHLYDRVYCGAGCPEQYLNYMKNLIKIGGILILPLNDQLVEMKRTSETNWNVRSLLPVSFASLVQPPEGSVEMVRLFDLEPLSLQELCRGKIRNLLRRTVEVDHPAVLPVLKPKRRRGLKKRKGTRKTNSKNRNSPRSGGRANDDHQEMSIDSPDFFDYFLMSVARPRRNSASTSNGGTGTSKSSSAEEQEGNGGTRQVKAVVEHRASSEDDDEDEGEVGMSDGEKFERVHEAFWDLLRAFGRREHNNSALDPGRPAREGAGERNEEGDDEATEENGGAEAVASDDALGPRRPEGGDVAPKKKRDTNGLRGVARKGAAAFVGESAGASSSVGAAEVEFIDPGCVTVSILKKMKLRNGSQETALVEDGGESSDGPEAESSAGPAPQRRKSNREKFDSGLGDEIISLSPPTDPVDMVEVATSSSEDEPEIRRCKRTSRLKLEKRSGSKFRRLENNRDEDDSSDEEACPKPADGKRKMYQSPYTAHMRDRIRELPLPSILKKYLDFYREP